MPQAAIGPAIAGLAAIGSTAIAAATSKNPSVPEISPERKKTLGSFAEMMSQQEKDFNESKDSGSIVLRPGGKPIYFPVKKNDYTYLNNV